MSKEILINSGIREVRAAVLTGGNVSEIFIERANKKVQQVIYIKAR